ncbi:MAG: LysR family transcriptional regulator [Xenophilus sp.]
MLRTALRFVEQVARAGSMRKAAENLHVASSAVNRQVLALEAELGVQLFERLPRGMRPTAAGEIVLSYVRRWEGEAQKLHHQLDELQYGAGGTVRLAATEAMVDLLLPPVFARIRQRLPRIAFDLETGDSHWVLGQVQTREADVGIAFNPPPTRGVRVVGNLRYRIHVIMTPEHPLAGASRLTLNDCAPYPVIFPSDRWLAGSVLGDAFATRADSMNVVVRTTHSSAIRTLARTGLGLAFLSPMEVAWDVERNLLKCIPLAEPSIPVGRLKLIVPSHGHASTYAAFAAECLRQDIFDCDDEP